MRNGVATAALIAVHETPSANVGICSAIASIALHPREELDARLLPVRDALDQVPRRAIEIAVKDGIRMHVLAISERYTAVSPTLERRGIDVDAWPVPPAGIFVMEERTVYVRSTSPVTIVHEFAHGLDCAMGGGVYRSGYDHGVGEAFRRASSFVTPYAAVSIDEYFAECFRAYVEVNEPGFLWPDVTRERLALHAPEMLSWFDREIGLDKASLT